MRYLEKIDTKVGGALFVAGWFNLKNMETDEEKSIAKPWIENPIDFKKLKENMGKVTLLISDNDPYGCLDENVKIFKEKLKANVIIKHNAEHFNNPKSDFILEEFIKLSK
jgi:predicted alpha/beta hydrolase family esterase